MPAATTKAELIHVVEKEYAKLVALIADIDGPVAMTKREADTSIKDIIGHRAHWIDLFFEWFEASCRGEVPDMPAKGYKWNQLVAYNAALREKQEQVDWTEARQMLRQAHDRLLTFLRQSDDETLYGRPMVPSKNAWTPGRWAEAAGPSHYRSAAKTIRDYLRSA